MKSLGLLLKKAKVKWLAWNKRTNTTIVHMVEKKERMNVEFSPKKREYSHNNTNKKMRTYQNFCRLIYIYIYT